MRIGDDAKVHLARVGLNGDVQRQAVRDDGQRVKGHQPGTSQVQRHLRSWHIADDQIGGHRQAVGQAGDLVGGVRGFGQATDQPGGQQ